MGGHSVEPERPTQALEDMYIDIYDISMIYIYIHISVYIYMSIHICLWVYLFVLDSNKQTLYQQHDSQL